jgi:3-isopropylmalate/(R)-2-methylmalate dehydratase small subunit
MRIPLDRVRGGAYLMLRDDCDTDTIFPARHMTTISRSGLAGFAFEALRADPASCFNDPRRRGSPFLIVGRNFGCGSSREHAVWALADLGVRVIVGRGFADIFAQNALENGIATVVLTAGNIEMLAGAAERYMELDFDLSKKVLAVVDGPHVPFEIAEASRAQLLAGRDSIYDTLSQEREINHIEKYYLKQFPWMQVNTY